jgi:hypothetical protein
MRACRREALRAIFDDRRRLQGVELEVPDWKHLELKSAATEDPFKLPVKAVNDLFQFHADGSEMHRARLMGVVTLRLPDGSFYLQDGSGGIQIQPAQSTPSRPDHVRRFQEQLLAAGVPCTVRQRRGIDIAAGCGQLRTREQALLTTKRS